MDECWGGDFIGLRQEYLEILAADVLKRNILKNDVDIYAVVTKWRCCSRKNEFTRPCILLIIGRSNDTTNSGGHGVLCRLEISRCCVLTATLCDLEHVRDYDASVGRLQPGTIGGHSEWCKHALTITATRSASFDIFVVFQDHINYERCESVIILDHLTWRSVLKPRLQRENKPAVFSCYTAASACERGKTKMKRFIKVPVYWHCYFQSRSVCEKNKGYSSTVI